MLVQRAQLLFDNIEQGVRILTAFELRHRDGTPFRGQPDLRRRGGLTGNGQPPFVLQLGAKLFARVYPHRHVRNGLPSQAESGSTLSNVEGCSGLNTCSETSDAAASIVTSTFILYATRYIAFTTAGTSSQRVWGSLPASKRPGSCALVNANSPHDGL